MPRVAVAMRSALSAQRIAVEVMRDDVEVTGADATPFAVRVPTANHGRNPFYDFLERINYLINYKKRSSELICSYSLSPGYLGVLP